MAKPGPELRRLVIAILVAAGVVFTGQGLWIPAKAVLAQHLLERAWQKTLLGRPRVAPWPWADTWPVARLIIRDHVLVVLADSGGKGLAFGPTHVAGSVPPGGDGTVVISGHRDTHFRRLGTLGPGEVIILETADGAVRRYRVTGSQVLDNPELKIPMPGLDNALALVTCWPLNGIDPGTRKRFVLHALAIAASGRI